MASYHIALALLVVAALVIVSGCINGGPVQETITDSGTVTYVELEGGFYGIVADDGTRYLPQNLPEEFAQDGLEVTFTAKVLRDVATIQQWGTPIEIIEISGGGMTTRVVSGA
ncbi:MAG: hypothetical protein RQ758_06895 [Methanomicrobiaceae archaeon]|nr:hypothetical protein [Methanomicrobiaceae archaeon]